MVRSQAPPCSRTGGTAGTGLASGHPCRVSHGRGHTEGSIVKRSKNPCCDSSLCARARRRGQGDGTPMAASANESGLSLRATPPRRATVRNDGRPSTNARRALVPFQLLLSTFECFAPDTTFSYEASQVSMFTAEDSLEGSPVRRRPHRATPRRGDSCCPSGGSCAGRPWRRCFAVRRDG